MSDSKNQNGFVMQAGILAAAGILCKIIGILYRSPLAHVIGDEGNGYYSTAYEFYTIILLVSSYSIPSAISKVIAQRLALKEYENARKIFRCAVAYVVIVGGTAAVLTFFFADKLVGGNSVPVLRTFAPTIFFSGLLGVLRGYYQAHGTMIPTSISQIVEQILNAIVSIGMAMLLMKTYKGTDATGLAIRGATGSAVGTGSGVLIGLAFMTFLYVISRKPMQQRERGNHGEPLLGTRQVFLIIITMVTPIILSTFIYNCNTTLNQTIYTRIMQHVKQVSEVDAYTQYGLFSGKAKQIANIPIAVASAMSAAIIPGISGSYARKDIKDTNRRIAAAIRTTMLLTIPSAIGLMVLAKPVVLLLYPQKASVDMVARLLAALAVSVLFYGLSTLSNGILQGLGKVNVPVINAALALVIQTVVLVPLLLWTDLGLYTLAIATDLYSLLMCVLNAYAVHRYLGYRQELIKTWVIPFWASLIMGGVAFGVYHLFYLLLNTNVISLAAAILAAVFVYFALVIRMGAVGESELKSFPKGYLLARVARKLHLL